jgi:hypothetical protein
LLQPSRAYFHFYKKGFLNSQAVRIRVKIILSLHRLDFNFDLPFLRKKNTDPDPDLAPEQ